MPISAIKPTDAGTDRNSPDAQSATSPPIVARNVAEHEDRLTHRAEGEIQQQENHGKSNGHNDGESGRRPLLILKLAAPNERVSARNFELGRDTRLGFIDEADQVAATHVG